MAERRFIPWARGVSRTVLAAAAGVLAAAATNAPRSVPGGSAAAPHAPVPDSLRDIRGPISIQSATAWAIRIGLAAVLAALLYAAWRHWRKRPGHKAAERVIPPGERARQRLAAALGLIEQPEPFCRAVSEIARAYLEERFGLRAPEQTTEEFLAVAGDSPVLEKRHRDLLAGFLTQCDLVKFARAEPGRPELEQMHAAAVRLVDETAPVAAPPTLQEAAR